MGGEVTAPWPKIPVGNKHHTNAAVVIIGAGISGSFYAFSCGFLITYVE
jgi:hypothetical protein